VRILFRDVVVLSSHLDGVWRGDVLVEDGRIQRMEKGICEEVHRVIQGDGDYLIPGFVQTHIHLCQTLFRGLAEDLPLLDWLEKKVLLFESKHTPDTIRASAKLGLCELMLGGTTTFMSMETVRYTDVVLEEVSRSKLRGFVGKAIMDRQVGNAPLFEDTEKAIKETVDLIERWDKQGKLRYAIAPRFVPSVKHDTWLEIFKIAEHYDVFIHTHSSENRDEIKLVEELTGKRNVEYFDSMGILTDRMKIAHCVWVDEQEIEMLRSSGAGVLHCPSSNFKLGSGIAPVVEMLREGLNLSIGADGASCNNNLDVFCEMRLAGLAQKVRKGADALPVKEIFRMATLGGAEVLGIADEIGTVEVGKRADLVLLGVKDVFTTPDTANPYARVVYSAGRGNVRIVMVDGEIVVEEGRCLVYDIDEVIRDANSACSSLVE